MKILLLGATGRTGRHILDLALHHGHQVRALVRDQKKVVTRHENLELIEGDPSRKEDLKKVMHGCEAIVSALNISRVSDWPWSRLRTAEDFLSKIATDIIELAPQFNIRRFIILSAWGVAETKDKIPGWFRWTIDHSNIKYPYLDHERAEKIVEQSTMEFTVVRPAALTNTKKTQEIIVSFNNSPKPNYLVSRYSVARFVLEVLEKGLYKREMPVISRK